MLRLKRKKAQSTLEYIVILTAIVGMIIFAAVTWIKPAVQQGIDDAGESIKNASEKLIN